MSDLYRESQSPVNKESYREETGNRTSNNATFFVAMKKTPEDIVRETWEGFGRWIFETREKLHLTQEQCAERAGMKRQQWNRIESGASTKRVTVLRIADALNADHSMALEKAGFLPKTPSVEPAETVEEVLRNAFLFGGKGLSDEEIEKLKPYMEMLDREIDRLEEQAAYIRKAADLLDEGFGAASVALKFTREQIPSPKGGAWSPNTIKNFFRDPAYKGEGYGWRYNRKKGGQLKGRAQQDWVKLAADAYPPIIEPERWDRLNARINKNKGIKARQEKQLWLLRGLVVCDLCEFPAYHVRSANKNSPTDPKALIYRHYQCGRWQSERNAGKPRSCFAARANGPALEAAAWAATCAFLRDPTATLDELYAQLPRTERDYSAEIAALERAAAGKLAEIRRLAERLRTAPALVAGHIESEMVTTETERLALEGQIAELRQVVGERLQAEQSLTDAAELATKFVGSLDQLSEQEKRDLLESLPFAFDLRGGIKLK